MDATRVLTRADVERALSRDADAMRVFLDSMTPIVQARVVRALLRRRGSAGRDMRQEMQDLVQAVFLAFFEDDGRALRAWMPDRGLSLANYVGLLAEREVASILRSGRRSPFTEDPTEQEDLDDATGPAPSLHAQVASRDMLERLLEALRSTLSPKGLRVFQMLYMEERSVEDVQGELGMGADAVYQWRSRISKQVRKLIAELDPSSSKLATAEVRAS
jgi:RNA polymerase sigma-70 factor (ECF subfamily)